MTEESTYVEASVPLGSAFITIGMSTWVGQAALSVFSTWMWAIAMGALWVVFGTLLLFPDMRVYQFGKSPLEKLVTDAERGD